MYRAVILLRSVLADVISMCSGLLMRDAYTAANPKSMAVVHNEAQKAAHAGAVLFLIGVERERRVGVPIALADYPSAKERYVYPQLT